MGLLSRAPKTRKPRSAPLVLPVLRWMLWTRKRQHPLASPCYIWVKKIGC